MVYCYLAIRKEVAMRPQLRRLLPSFLGFVLLSVPQWSVAQNRVETPSAAHNPLAGADIFRHYCATCHGTDGRGHGPASVALKHAVPDLTQIAKRNGGTFPFKTVKEVISGTNSKPIAHGNREMPVWGPIFHEVDSDQDLGEVRLDNITRYLELMQQK